MQAQQFYGGADPTQPFTTRSGNPKASPSIRRKPSSTIECKWDNGDRAISLQRENRRIPLQPPLTGRLWSPLAGIDPQNCGTIWASAHEISTSRDWLAVGAVWCEPASASEFPA